MNYEGPSFFDSPRANTEPNGLKVSLYFLLSMSMSFQFQGDDSDSDSDSNGEEVWKRSVV